MGIEKEDRESMVQNSEMAKAYYSGEEEEARVSAEEFSRALGI